jgi:hypothetical protein
MRIKTQNIDVPIWHRIAKLKALGSRPHSVDWWPGKGRGSPLDAGNAGPVIVALFGGGNMMTMINQKLLQKISD